MRKNGKQKIKDKVMYEDSPWGDDDPVIGEFITDLLPPAHVMKKAKVRYIRESDEVSLPLRASDSVLLHQKAKRIGLTPQAFIVGIIHDFLRGNLVRA